MKLFSGDETHKQLLVILVYQMYSTRASLTIYYLDDVSGLPEHIVNLLAVMPIQRFPVKRFATKAIVKTC